LAVINYSGLTVCQHIVSTSKLIILCQQNVLLLLIQICNDCKIKRNKCYVFITENKTKVLQVITFTVISTKLHTSIKDKAEIITQYKLNLATSTTVPVQKNSLFLSYWQTCESGKYITISCLNLEPSDLVHLRSLC